MGVPGTNTEALYRAYLQHHELGVLEGDRLRCREAWAFGLSALATHGALHPTVADYERLEHLLRALKISQKRIDDFARAQTPKTASPQAEPMRASPR